MISEIAQLMRETRDAVNDLEASVAAAVGLSTSETVLVVDPAQTDLVVGVDVQDTMIEVVRLSAVSAEVVENITGARSGQIKILVFDDADVTVSHDVAKIVLNGGSSFGGTVGDVLAIRNVGGIPASAVDGHWVELFRTEAV